LVRSSPVAMRSEFAVDTGAQGLEFVDDIVEKVAPERGNLTVGFTQLGLESGLGKCRRNKLIVTADHNEKTHQGKTTIFQHSVSVWTNRYPLKGTILLTLDFDLKNLVLEDIFIDLDGSHTFGSDK